MLFCFAALSENKFSGKDITILPLYMFHCIIKLSFVTFCFAALPAEKIVRTLDLSTVLYVSLYCNVQLILFCVASLSENKFIVGSF